MAKEKKKAAPVAVETVAEPKPAEVAGWPKCSIVFDGNKDYRIEFKTGLCQIYHGAALNTTPPCDFDSVCRIHDYSTGDLVFEITE